jgi:ribosomal protein S18 acetylase RimI-like enzyme
MVRIVEGSETWASGEQIAEIETMSIHPDFRGEGLGSKILSSIYDHLRKDGIREIGVAVVDTNAQAISFYERHGFKKRTIYMWGDVPEGEE